MNQPITEQTIVETEVVEIEEQVEGPGFFCGLCRGFVSIGEFLTTHGHATTEQEGATCVQ